MAQSSSGTSKVVWVLEMIFAVSLLGLVCCITYPLYVMSDRTRPTLDVDRSVGYISVATLSMIGAALYSLLILISALRDVLGASKIPAAALVVVLLFFGWCDLLNAIRYQDRIANNKDKFGEHDEPNDRANTVVAFMLFDFVLAVCLLCLALAAAAYPRSTDAPSKVPTDSDEENNGA
mmetsp:Transcript_4531/g.13834  ORF Transcript_4531/g.13834 Transcript_4531/m.13834 type:complete len:178 (-) Transcript_4531:107-640(-)